MEGEDSIHAKDAPTTSHDKFDRYDMNYPRVDRLLDDVVRQDKSINFGLKRSRSTVEVEKEEEGIYSVMDIYRLIKKNKKAKK